MFVTDYFFDFNDEMVAFLEDFANNFLKRDGFSDYAATILKRLKNSENRKPPWDFFDPIDWSKRTSMSLNQYSQQPIATTKQDIQQENTKKPDEGQPAEASTNSTSQPNSQQNTPRKEEAAANPAPDQQIPTENAQIPTSNANSILLSNSGANLTTIPPEKFAEQLTYMDFTFYSFINWTEISEQSWAKEKKQYRAQFLLRFIQFLNKISNLVGFYVCSEKDEKKRVNLLKFFLKTLASLLEMNSVSMIQAIFSGLKFFFPILHIFF